MRMVEHRASVARQLSCGGSYLEAPRAVRLQPLPIDHHRPGPVPSACSYRQFEPAPGFIWLLHHGQALQAHYLDFELRIEAVALSLDRKWVHSCDRSLAFLNFMDLSKGTVYVRWHAAEIWS